MIETYFIGREGNEYQVWDGARIVYRSADCRKIVDYMVKVYRNAKDRISLHTIPPAQGIEEQIKEALGKMQKSSAYHNHL
ncbi:hypothetical protein HYX05_03200 [Candidatus Woesearchaeota archaeon]|nr:hypothetical protein [Candidatus Woesearchaeota archaeon]